MFHSIINPLEHKATVLGNLCGGAANGELAAMKMDLPFPSTRPGELRSSVQKVASTKELGHTDGKQKNVLC